MDAASVTLPGLAPFGVLFADARAVVLDKPAGLPCHAGPSGGRSVEDAFPLLSRRRDGPWLVHRLDADTAGCLLVALRKSPLVAAQALFAAGRVRKTYWAVVDGHLDGRGEIDAPLRKVSGPLGWRMEVGPGGLAAQTRWRALAEHGGQTLLELTPRTGRTHQVRAHCAHLGHPIVGDRMYGAGRGPLQLLARALHVPLEPPIEATAPVPVHMSWVSEMARSGTTPGDTVP